MYCRNCGAMVNDKAVICVKCGCRPTNGDNYCQSCGARTVVKQFKCTQCGSLLNNSIESFDDIKIDIDFSAPHPFNAKKKLTPYMQKECQKIHNSNGAYKGKFNICAFLFGPLWGLTNFCVFEAIIAIIASVLTAGFGTIIAAFLFGFRGNYWNYKNFVSSQKLGVFK